MGYIQDNLTGRSKRRWQIVKIGFTPPVYLTDCDVDIEYAAATWVAAGVTFGEVQSREDGASASFRVPDADHSIFQLLLDTNGAENLTVEIWVAEFALDSVSATPNDTKQVFSGRVSTAMKDTAAMKDEVEFRCGPPVSVKEILVPTRLLTSLVRRK